MPETHRTEASDDSERTLLLDERATSPRPEVSLPKLQLFILSLLQFTEEFSATIIFPFAPILVLETGITGGDVNKLGYYTGLLEAMLYFMEFVTVFSWGRASDKIGRRPILAIGPIGLAVAMIGFGLSHNFWILLMFRGLQGVFNGNIAVAMTAIGEITEADNAAETFSIVPVMWIIGCLGPFVGGVLAKPADTWPGTFGKVAFFHQFPYFLSCAAGALVAIIAFAFVASGFKESRIEAVIKPNASSTDALLDGHHTTYGSTGHSGPSPYPASALPEISSPAAYLLRDPVFRITILNYAALAFSEMAHTALLPIMYSSPIHAGGLSLTPAQTGLILGIVTVVGVILQLTICPWVTKRTGPRQVYIVSVMFMALSMPPFAFMTMLARKADSVTPGVIVWLIIEVLTGMFAYPAYSSMLMMINQNCDRQDCLASANSMAQMGRLIVTIITTPIVTSLFAYSSGHADSLHGFGACLVYVIVTVVHIFIFWLAFKLPRN